MLSSKIALGVVAGGWALACISGCDGSAEATSDGRYTLVGTVGESQGVDLDSGGIAPVDFGKRTGSLEVEFYLSLAMEVSLQGEQGEAFCLKGSGFANVSDIPASTDDCTWLGARLGGNAPNAPDPIYAEPGDGWLFRDLEDEGLYRVRLVAAEMRPDGYAEVTVDVERVD